MSAKGKGSEFERLICKQLSLWISGGERTDLLWRSSISGGRATRRQQKGENVQVQLGDICAVDPMGHSLTDQFYIECKHYKDIGLQSFILKNMGPLAYFWKDTKEKAIQYKRQPMLIGRQNMYPIFVLLPTSVVWPDRPMIRVAASMHAPQSCSIVLFDDMIAGPYWYA